jgi:hypothetical protein
MPDQLAEDLEAARRDGFAIRVARATDGWPPGWLFTLIVPSGDDWLLAGLSVDHMDEHGARLRLRRNAPMRRLASVQGGGR